MRVSRHVTRAAGRKRTPSACTARDSHDRYRPESIIAMEWRSGSESVHFISVEARLIE
jgi:hypothetical protein